MSGGDQAKAGSAAAILVTVRETWGSAPREAGAAMLVGATGTDGTIGGGNLEWRAIAAAREMLAAGEVRRELVLPLGPTLGQCCGGQVMLELRRLTPAVAAELAARRSAERAEQPQVAIFGAGHVGRALAHALAPLPCRVRLIDPRPDMLALLGDLAVDRQAMPVPVAAVAGLPAHGFVLVMTHSHPQDLEIVTAALARGDQAWVGLIGSLTKRRRFESRLRARGLAEAALGRLVCPIGLAGIDGKAPAVIAASVAAQLLLAFEARRAVAGLRGAA